MIERIGQALHTVGPVGIFVCLIVGGLISLIIVLGRR